MVVTYGRSLLIHRNTTRCCTPCQCNCILANLLVHHDEFTTSVLPPGGLVMPRVGGPIFAVADCRHPTRVNAQFHQLVTARNRPSFAKRAVVLRCPAFVA